MKLLKNKFASGMIAYIVLMLILALLPHISNDFTIFLISRILILGLLSMSLILMAGYGGLNSLAQVVFFAIAGYTIAIGQVWKGMSYFPSALLGLLLTIIVAALFGLFSKKTDSNAFFMMTLAFANLAHISSLQWVELTRGYNGINNVPGPIIGGKMFSGIENVYYIVIIVVPLCYIALKKIVNSPFGIALQGTRDNKVKMSSLGFNVDLIRVLLVTIAGFFAGISGILHTTFYSLIAPEMIAPKVALMVLFMSLIGSIKNLKGAFVGAAVYVLLEDFFSQYTMRYPMIIGALFIVVVLLMPDGILGLPIFQRKLSKLKLKNPTNI